MAKYAELEASVCVSVSGMIAGNTHTAKDEAEGEDVAKGGECRKSTDTEQKGVTV